MPPTSLGQFRLVGLIEGVSYLLIFLVGMPLKYFAHIRWPNYIIGGLHGALVVVFCLLLLKVVISRKWGWQRTLLAFSASLIPIGTFLMEGTLRRELAQEAAEASSASQKS